MKVGYLIKRTNMSDDNRIMYIGKRFNYGMDAEPYSSVTSAESSMKQQVKQDMELCPECVITYEVVDVRDIDREAVV